jgi:hypothetical protein
LLPSEHFLFHFTEPVKDGSRGVNQHLNKIDIVLDLNFYILPNFPLLVSKNKFKSRLKREYRKTMDRLIRSHAFHKLAVRMIYLIGFIISVFLATLLYFDK